VKYLLDTHVWVWWQMNPKKLSPRIRTLLNNPDHYTELHLSVISHGSSVSCWRKNG